MEEIVLLYNFENTKVGDAITTILEQLHVKIKHIQEEEIMHPIGYLLNIKGFNAAKEQQKTTIVDQMLIIHNFSDKQINIMLELFKNASIPYIPLKAIVTEQNIHWSFHDLHEHVKEEYEMMAGVQNQK